MGHCLHAVVAAESVIRRFSDSWFHASVIILPQGFALTPLTNTLFDAITNLADDKQPGRYAEFTHLSSGVEVVLRELSCYGPVAYLETDYFGGVGQQAAIAWHEAVVRFGPQVTFTDASARAATGSISSSINLALQVLGVRAGHGNDHFGTLELGRYRQTELEEG